MNIYKIYQDVNEGYDTYDSAVVIAESEEDARNIHPGNIKLKYIVDAKGFSNWQSGWAKPENVGVLLVGKALDNAEREIICASFNAG